VIRHALIAAAAVLVAGAAHGASPRDRGSRPGIGESIEAMYAAVRAKDEAGAANAAAAIVRFGDEAAAAIVTSTTGRAPAELVWALRCLREIGPAAAKDTVISLCDHSSAEVRAEAVWTAHGLDAAAATPALLRAAGDGDATVRRRAFDGLAQSPTASRASGGLDVAVRGVVDADAWVILRAFEMLDHLPRGGEDGRTPDRVVEALARIVPELDDRNASAAVSTIVRRAGPRATPILVQALTAKRREVVIAALDGLGQVRASSALPAVHGLAGSADMDVAVAATKAIARTSEAASVPILVDLLEQARDPRRIDALAVALRTITGKLHGTDVAAWRKYLSAL
jgi:hypothetical protein